MTTGFKSFLYRSGYVYDFVAQRLVDQKKKFKTIASIINMKGCQTVLDLPCGTGYITRYLDPSIFYEGWDLNRIFLSKIKKDWYRGRYKLKKVVLRQKNIFDFKDYPKEKVDVIILCDIMHHICPQHFELVKNAKEHAKMVVLCEPVTVKPENIRAHDWIAKTTMFFIKYFPEKLLKMIDYFFADNDGINSYKDRSQWHYDGNGIKALYRQFGVSKIHNMLDDYIGIWEE